MKYLILTLVILLLTVSQPIFSQKKTSILETVVKKLEERIIHTNEEKKQIPSKTPNVSNSQKNKIDNNEEIIIPVVFHVVMKEKPTSLLVISQFQNNLILLNEALNNTNPVYINPEYRSIIGQANIKFVLADAIYNCETVDGFTFHYTDKEKFQYVDTQNNTEYGFYDGSLKKHGYLDSDKFLNIWICRLDNSNALGYSTFPQEKNKKNDGIVINFDAFFSPIEDTRRFAISHEVGHYLGLRHIWNGCNSIQGDLVSDTPPQGNKNSFESVLAGNIEKVCFSTQNSNYQNYMDYVGQYGMFTKGQIKRMREQIKIYRSELLERGGCPEIANTISTSSNSQTVLDTDNVGEVCFSNPNMYSRKVILTNIKTGVATSIVIGLAYYPKSTTRCAYKLENGIYNCKVYTTFSNTLTEDFQLKVTSSSQVIKIARNEFN